ncbi:MAG: PIN domain-containing protein [Acidobacteriota bacterium]|jgi:predicted nucleic acid-binding protein|nr:PIN domain-containing protein [Acidobacteriota bacterium]
MTQKNIRVFLDTSVIFAAVLSADGGARQLFRLAEAGVVQLLVGASVLREAEEVTRRKAPASLATLARLLHVANIEVCADPDAAEIAAASRNVQYPPDAQVLAEAIRARPDWFVSHDKEHFLKRVEDFNFAFSIGTPGDALQFIRDSFSKL